MKLVFLILLLQIAGTSWAFEYQLDEESLLRPSIVDAYELGQNFKRHGYNSLSDSGLINGGLPFDHVYVSYQWKRSLILKAGLAVPQKLEGKILTGPSVGTHVFHFRFRGTPYMLMALDMEENELKNIVRPWLKEEVSIFSLLIPSAYANDCELPQVQFQELHSTAASMERSQLLNRIGQCGMEALKGARNSASDTLDFFKKLATNPSALWAETKASFLQLKEFVVNIQSELQTAFKALQGMELNQKLDLACSLTGSLFVASAQVMVMGPAALGRILPGLLLKLRQTTALLAKMGSLQKKGIKLPDSKKLTTEVMSCVP